MVQNIEKLARDYLMNAYREWQLDRDRDLQAFAAELEPWLQHTWHKLPYDGWRDQWRQFCARWEVRGVRVLPDSAAEFEDWLGDWETTLRAEQAEDDPADRPFVADEHAPQHDAAPALPMVPLAGVQDAGTIAALKRIGRVIMQTEPPDKWLEEAKKRIAGLGVPATLEEQFLEWIAHLQGLELEKQRIPRLPRPQQLSPFRARLHEIKATQASMKEIVDALGAKIDQAQLGEDVDMDLVVDNITGLLQRQNEAIIEAQQIWLEQGLSHDDMYALQSITRSSAIGLPIWVSPDYERLEKAQWAKVNEVSMKWDRWLGAAQVTLKASEWTGTAASVALGAGVLVQAVKTGGKWTIVKFAASAVTAIAVDAGSEHAARSLGASDQAIAGAHAASALISYILLRRRMGGGHEARATLPRQEKSSKSPPTKLGNGPHSSHDEPRPKPPLPPPDSDDRVRARAGSKARAAHELAEKAERESAEFIQTLPDEVVILWGKPIGSHGSDVVSYNMKAGVVTLWDVKARSASTLIQGSETFVKESTRQTALKEAEDAIARSGLSEIDKKKGLRSISDEQYHLRTIGAENAKNSVKQK